MNGEHRKKKEQIFSGIGVYPAIVIGKVTVAPKEEVEIPRYQILKKYIPFELKRFENALNSSRSQLEEILSRIDEGTHKEVYSILEIKKMFLSDSSMMDKVKNLIEKEQVNAEWAIEKILKEMEKFFEKINDPYLRERKEDLYFVTTRLIKNLKGEKSELREATENLTTEIFAAHDLSPVDVIRLTKSNVKGVIIEVGGKNSHTSITLRSLETAGVVGVENFIPHSETGDIAIVDGIHGTVILNPTARMLEKYSELIWW